MLHVGNADRAAAAAVVTDEAGREDALVADHDRTVHRPVRDERHIVVRHFTEPDVVVPLVRAIVVEIDLAVARQAAEVRLAPMVRRAKPAVSQLQDGLWCRQGARQVVGLSSQRREDASEAFVLGLVCPAGVHRIV